MKEKNDQIEFAYKGETEESKLKPKRTKYRDMNKVCLVKMDEDVDTVECAYKLTYITNVFKTVVAPDFYISLSQEEGIRMTFYLDAVKDDVLTQKYKLPKVGGLNPGIVVKIYSGKDI